MNMAPLAEREANRRREMALGMFASWKLANAEKLAKNPDDLSKAIRVYAMQRARDAALAGRLTMGITAADWDGFYRAFISQVRAARHGPIAFVSAEEWRTQIAAICEEYGRAWPEIAKRQEAA